MIWSYRDGELSAREKDELSHHVSGCTSCARELREVGTYERVVGGIRRNRPSSGFPEDLVDSVLLEINRGPAVAKQRHRGGFGDRLWDFVLLAQIRYGCAVLSMAALTLWIIQGVALLGSLTSLEQQIASSTAIGRGVEVAYSMSASTSAVPPEMKRLEKLVLDMGGIREDGVVVIARETVEQFLVGDRLGVSGVVRLASVLGSDPGRLIPMAKYLEQHSNTELHVDTERR